MGGIDITGAGNKIIRLADPARNQYVVFVGGVSLMVDEHWISEPNPRLRLKLRLELVIGVPAVAPLWPHIFTTSNECMFIQTRPYRKPRVDRFKRSDLLESDECKVDGRTSHHGGQFSRGCHQSCEQNLWPLPDPPRSSECIRYELRLYRS
jgi:hypothetical protein